MTARAYRKGGGIAEPAARAALLRYAVPLMIGLAPVATMLVSSMDPADPIMPWERAVKAFALPVVAMELLVILLALLGPGRWAPSGLSRRWLAGAAALLALMVGTACFSAVSPATALARTALWIVHLGFSWSVFRLRERSAAEPEAISSALMAGFLVFCALLLLYISRIQDPLGFRWLNDLPGLDNIRRGAYFAAPIAGLCIARFSAARGPALGFAAAVLTLAVLFIFWSGARGAASALAASCLVGAALFAPMRQLRVVQLTAACSAAGIFLAWLYGIQTGYPGFWRMFSAAAQGSADPYSDLSSGRAALWTSAWQTVLERPLFGYGEGQTALVVPLGIESQAFHPHNLALQVLLAWGLVGAVLLACLAAPVARRLFENARAASDCLPPFMAMLVLFVYSGIDGTLFHVHAVSIFAACAGVIGIRETRRAAGQP